MSVDSDQPHVSRDSSRSKDYIREMLKFIRMLVSADLSAIVLFTHAIRLVFHVVAHCIYGEIRKIIPKLS